MPTCCDFHFLFNDEDILKQQQPTPTIVRWRTNHNRLQRMRKNVTLRYILKDGVLMELFSQKNTNNNNNINDVSSSTSAMYKMCEKDSDLEYNETKKRFKTLEKALNLLADNVKTLQNQNLTVNCQLKKLKTKLDGKMTTTSAPGKKRNFPRNKTPQAANKKKHPYRKQLLDLKSRPMVADPELPDIDIARPRAHCSSSSPNTDTPFVPDAAPQADTLINLLVPSVSCDAAPQGDTSINLLAHTVSSDAASPKMFASPEIFLGYPKAAPRKENQQREKTWKMYDRNIITNDGGNKIKAVH
ncbi:hypothetical protein BgiMline_031571 [Biomphalaria glabrata]